VVEKDIVRAVEVHQCGRELAGERDAYPPFLREDLNHMDAVRGPMETLHAPRYKGHNPYGPGTANMVNVYTDTGRVPFGWLRPVKFTMPYNMFGVACSNAFAVVESGTRCKMEALFQRLKPSRQLLFEECPWPWESDEDLHTGLTDDAEEEYSEDWHGSPGLLVAQKVHLAEQAAWEDAVQEAVQEATAVEEDAQDDAAEEYVEEQAAWEAYARIGSMAAIEDRKKKEKHEKRKLKKKERKKEKKAAEGNEQEMGAKGKKQQKEGK
jgi:hypothetical protein